MCGRFTLTTDATRLQAAFPELSVPAELEPRYNIAPSQPVAVIASDDPSRLAFFRWGLIPSWAKDAKIGNRMINARAESLAEKPAFRAAYRARRCLVLADGFYEWRKGPGGSRVPFYIQLADGTPFAFAGLWESWRTPEGEEWRTCTIITGSPNELVATIHDRMPVILPREAYATWLDAQVRDTGRLDALLEPYPAEQMQAYEVTSLVNNPRIDTPACVTAA